MFVAATATMFYNTSSVSGLGREGSRSASEAVSWHIGQFEALV